MLNSPTTFELILFIEKYVKKKFNYVFLALLIL